MTGIGGDDHIVLVIDDSRPTEMASYINEVIT
jgi:hypothetical protein